MCLIDGGHILGDNTTNTTCAQKEQPNLEDIQRDMYNIPSKENM